MPHLHSQSPIETQAFNDLIDPNDPGIYAEEYAALAEEERLTRELWTIVTTMVQSRRRPQDRADHRTGFFTHVMEIMATALMAEGWSVRQVTDALVLEAVRAGGNIENRALRKRIAAKKTVQP